MHNLSQSAYGSIVHLDKCVYFIHNFLFTEKHPCKTSVSPLFPASLLYTVFTINSTQHLYLIDYPGLPMTPRSTTYHSTQLRQNIYYNPTHTSAPRKPNDFPHSFFCPKNPYSKTSYPLSSGTSNKSPFLGIFS